MLGLKLDRWAGGWADDPPSSHLDSNPRWRGQWKPLLQSPIEIQTKVDPKVRNHGEGLYLRDRGVNARLA